jgi:hypothetical protein
MSITYLDRKDLIRSELVKSAKAGETPFYSEFGVRVGIPAQGPWKPVLDLISKEETAAGRPDITFILINKMTGFPGQISFSKANPPTLAQKDLARQKLREVFDQYCPSAKVPF